MPHCGRRWARSVYFFPPGWVSSVTFLPVLVKVIFFLTLVTSAAASAAAQCCPSPDSARHASLPYYGRRRAHAVLLNSRCGGCFGRQKCAPLEKRESDGAENIGGRRFFKSNNNQPKDEVCGGGLSGRARDGGGRCQGWRFTMFGAAIWATK